MKINFKQEVFNLDVIKKYMNIHPSFDIQYNNEDKKFKMYKVFPNAKPNISFENKPLIDEGDLIVNEDVFISAFNHLMKFLIKKDKIVKKKTLIRQFSSTTLPSKNDIVIYEHPPIITNIRFSKVDKIEAHYNGFFNDYIIYIKDDVKLVSHENLYFVIGNSTDMLKIILDMQ